MYKSFKWKKLHSICRIFKINSLQLGGAGVWYGVSLTLSFSDDTGVSGQDVLVGGVDVDDADVESDIAVAGGAGHQCRVEVEEVGNVICMGVWEIGWA